MPAAAHHHHLHRQILPALVLEAQRRHGRLALAVVRPVLAHEGRRARAAVHVQSHLLDLSHQSVVPALVDLPTHESGSELDDVRRRAHVLDGLGGLQSQQAAADHRHVLHAVVLHVGQHGLQILDGPVHEHARSFSASRYGRHEGVAPRGHHGRVVRQRRAAFARHRSGRRVHGHGAVVHQYLHAVLVVPRRRPVLVELGRHAQRRRVAGLEVRGQSHAVVRGAGLLAKGGHATPIVHVELEEVLHEALSDHAVTDHDDALPPVVLVVLAVLVGRRRGPSIEAAVTGEGDDLGTRRHEGGASLQQNQGRQ